MATSARVAAVLERATARRLRERQTLRLLSIPLLLVVTVPALAGKSHVSGHGSEEELKLMLSLVKPRFFIPVHGEYRQLSKHARVAKRVFRGDNLALAAVGHGLDVEGIGVF